MSNKDKKSLDVSNDSQSSKQNQAKPSSVSDPPQSSSQPRRKHPKTPSIRTITDPTCDITDVQMNHNEGVDSHKEELKTDMVLEVHPKEGIVVDLDINKPTRERLRAEKRPRRKVCVFCEDKIQKIDYTDINRLKKCMTEKGKILPRRVTGTCELHQRQLTRAIKKARDVAQIPDTANY